MRKATPLVVAGLAAAAAGIPVALGASAKTVVPVKLKEFKVLPAKTSVKAGVVSFSAKNVGKLAHELEVVKTNLSASKLPVKNSRVTLKPLGKVGPFKPGSGKTLTLTLKPGKYVLLCNVPGHYLAGQRVAFTVK